MPSGSGHADVLFAAMAAVTSLLEHLTISPGFGLRSTCFVMSGFGGGGMHGYRALEGTFLGGCIFSGRAAGRASAAAVL